MEHVMKVAHPDFIQICYSIVTREVEERLLPLAAHLGIGVIVNSPLETAGLFGRVRESPCLRGRKKSNVRAGRSFC